MRFLVSAPALIVPTTSNGSESDDVQLEIIELVILIHLLEESPYLLLRDGHALLCRKFHHPLVGRFRVCSEQAIQLCLNLSGRPHHAVP